MDLDGKTAGTVTTEDETAAKTRVAGPAKRASSAAPWAETSLGAQSVPNALSTGPGAENEETRSASTSAPKRLSLADLREAGRRRRETAG